MYLGWPGGLICILWARGVTATGSTYPGQATAPAGQINEIHLARVTEWPVLLPKDRIKFF